MKKLNFKRLMALVLSFSALFTAASASSACIILAFNEPKMPKSLYKKN